MRLWKNYYNYLWGIYIFSLYFCKNSIIFPRTFMCNWSTRLRIASLVFIRPFQKSKLLLPKIDNLFLDELSGAANGLEASESHVGRWFTHAHVTNLLIIYGLAKFICGTPRGTALPYALQALPLEYALNIMAISTCSYKPQNVFFASSVRYPLLTAGYTLKWQVVFINNFWSHVYKKAILI